MNINHKYPYTEALRQKAVSAYLSRTSHHAALIMLLCGLSLIPLIFLNRQQSDLTAAVIMFLGAAVLLSLQRKRAQQLLEKLPPAQSNDLIGELAIDDRFVHWQINRMTKALEPTDNEIDQTAICQARDTFQLENLQNFIATDTLWILQFQDNQLAIADCHELANRKDTAKHLLNRSRKAAKDMIQSLYQLFSIILSVFTILNVFSAFAALF